MALISISEESDRSRWKRDGCSKLYILTVSMRLMRACLASGCFLLGFRCLDRRFCFVLLEAFDLTVANIYKCLKQ